MQSGSLEAIWYVFCQFIDEVLHAFDSIIGDTDWRFRFCQWAHRKDGG